MAQKLNLNEWLKENEQNFVPPVCNKLMFRNQLKIMFVGGSNERLDFHIEEGEVKFIFINY